MAILEHLFESRSHPKNPASWLLYGLDAPSGTYTGTSVDENSSLRSTAVWAAVRILSETIASLPLHLYKRLDRGKERASEHPLYLLLHMQPNPEMATMILRESLMSQVLLWGNAYAEIEYDKQNKVSALWPLLSCDMEPKRVEGKILYIYHIPGTGQTAILPKERVLHIVGLSTTGVLGINPIKTNRESVGLSLALEEYAARFFGNSAKPAAVIEHPGHLGEKGLENLRASWESSQGGLSNAHRTAILEEGMKLHEYGISPEQAQAIEARKFQLEEVARIFNVPSHLLKNLDKASYANIEQQSLEFVIYSLRPWLVRLEQTFTTQLLTDIERKDYFFEHLVDGLLRGDFATRHSAFVNGRQWGYYSANDIREMENMNPIEGGDMYLVPLNMVDAKEAGKPQEPEPVVMEPPEEEPEEGRAKRDDEDVVVERLVEQFRQPYQAVFARIANKEILVIERAFQKHMTERNKVSFMKYIEDFYRVNLSNDIRANWFPLAETFMGLIHQNVSASIGIPDEMTPELKRWTDKYLEGFVARYTGQGLSKVQSIMDGIAEGVDYEIGKKLSQGRWKNLAELTADEELRRSSFAKLRERYRSKGVTVLRWRANANACPFCKSIDGRKVGIDEPFVQDMELLSGAKELSDGTEKDYWLKNRGPKFHPPIHRGCMCRITKG